jgi:hypothetical protein
MSLDKNLRAMERSREGYWLRYRADILQTLEIEEPRFAANVETGLKPLLVGHDIDEVPVSWINRTEGMGSASLRIVRVAPGYFCALMRIIWRVWRGRRISRSLSRSSTPRPNTSMRSAGPLAEREQRDSR